MELKPRMKKDGAGGLHSGELLLIHLQFNAFLAFSSTHPLLLGGSATGTESNQLVHLELLMLMLQSSQLVACLCSAVAVLIVKGMSFLQFGNYICFGMTACIVFKRILFLPAAYSALSLLSSKSMQDNVSVEFVKSFVGLWLQRTACHVARI